MCMRFALDPAIAKVIHDEYAWGFGDWHDTVTGRVTVFRARSVVGGVFIKMMMDESLYGKWSRRAAAK